MSDETLENLSVEDRVFPPSPEFTKQANAQSDIYSQAENYEAFWANQALQLDWAQPFSEILDWSNAPFARWFADGKLNVSVNCVDRHVDAGLGDRVAFYFEGEPGDTRTITYSQLKDQVCQAAHAFTSLGVKAGDRVAIYLPMIPEAVISMLACARIGAVHSVVFGGFSAEALLSRIIDAQATLVITADGGYRRGAAAALKPAVDQAVAQAECVQNVLVVRRTSADVNWNSETDVW